VGGGGVAVAGVFGGRGFRGGGGFPKMDELNGGKKISVASGVDEI